MSTSTQVCYPISSHMFLIINIVLHIFILYSFISLFFMLYVSKTEKKAFNNEFSDIITENLTEALQTADKDSGGQLKTVLQGLGPALQSLANIYSAPSPEVTTYNQWLFRSSFYIMFSILFTFGLMVAMLKYSCGTCMPLSHLIKENLIVFAVIGMAEYLFFTRIAANFVPVPPSLLVSTLIQQLKTDL